MEQEKELQEKDLVMELVDLVMELVLAQVAVMRHKLEIIVTQAHRHLVVIVLVVFRTTVPLVINTKEWN